MEITPRLLLPAALVALVALIPGSVAAASLNGPPGRHHLSLTAGYARHLGTVTGGSYVGIPESWATPPDLDDALDLGAGYRVSLKPGVDLALEAHRVEATGTSTVQDMLSGRSFSSRQFHRTDWWGLGMRRTFTAGGFRPFFQLGLVYAREARRSGESEWSPVASDLGFAMATGGEVALGSSLSLPIEVGLMYAQPEQDVSTLGVRTGVTWHPGR